MLNLPIAHALGARQDLPLPEWLFIWGAAVVLVASFVGLAVLWSRPRLEQPRSRPIPRQVSDFLLSMPIRIGLGLFSVALLLLVFYSGLEGTEAVTRNFAVTFVFVTFWLGVPIFSVLFGNVFAAVNPWRAIALATAWGFRAVAGQPPPAPLSYPRRLGRWPAALGLCGFLYLELISGFTPHSLAVASLLYSAITFLGMSLFGIERWLERGESFSVYFSMYGRLGAFAVERSGTRRRLVLRKPFTAVSGWAAGVPGSVALLVVAIGGTSFDGSREGLFRQPLGSLIDGLVNLGVSIDLAAKLGNTIFMLAVIGLVAAVFWLGLAGMRLEIKTQSLRELADLFAHAFIPIAFAYLLAHYFSLFTQQEQAQFSYLLSDPLGDGSDLFGTAGHEINYGVVGAAGIAYIQAGSIAFGHALGIALGHDKALALFRNTRRSINSQLFMLAAMIALSTFALLLLFKANG